ncbi:MAG: cupin domain-containing protein [Terrimicrobiaceae bacterium]|nr:cupin domain-containing protein [Terrimicrobiaceae bacterium]
MTPDIQILTHSQSAKRDFDWGNLTWFAGQPLGNSTDMTVGCCILKPDRGNPRHYHPNCSEILVVIRGRIEHTGANGEKVEMSEGDTVTIPSNIWHHATNVGETEAVLFIAFSSADRQTVGE